MLGQSRFKKEDCRTVEFPGFRFGIGLGALGEHFEDCQGRFGELLAAAGAVAYLPTDGTNIADYVVATGNSTAEAQICYGIIFQGSAPQPFSHLVRFEAKKEAGHIERTVVAQWPQFELAAHHRIVVNKLETVDRGEIHRLILLCPPRHGKSLLATQLFPTWYQGPPP